MRTAATDVGMYFQSLKGLRPWRARRGHGSFLTFEFGPRVMNNGHTQGTWHLWIYLANWVLNHKERQLADSDSDRHLVDVAIRRLEEVPFTGVEFDSERLKTVFSFDHFQLLVSPSDYIDNPDQRDEYWLFFMPEQRVLTVGPGGVRTGSASA